MGRFLQQTLADLSAMRITKRSAKMRAKEGRNGYTLIELVVSMAITALLAGLLMAAIQRVRAAQFRMNCLNNLRQIALALHQYESARMTLPEGCSGEGNDVQFPFMSWHTRILPYLERLDLWDQAVRAYAQESDFRVDPPHPFSTVLPIFACESDPRTFEVGIAPANIRVGHTIYLGVLGTDLFKNDGVLFERSHVRLTEITDGTANTLMVGERPPSPEHLLGWWYAGWGQNKSGSMDLTLGTRERNVYPQYVRCSRGPYHFQTGDFANPCDAFHFWSAHAGGANFAFCDGSARFLSYSADNIMPALGTRAGAESTGSFD